MPTLGQFSAWIEIDGTRIPEYGAEVSANNKTATSWIASEVGKNFTICYSGPTKREIILDGTIFHNRHCTKKDNDSRVDGQWISEEEWRPLSFSNVVFSDEAISQNVNEMGSIVIRCWKVIREASETAWSLRASLRETPVHEKSAKAIAHRVNLGETRNFKKRPKQTKSVVSFQGKDPALEVIFRYRPLDVLQAKGIAPGGSQQLEAPRLKINAPIPRPVAEPIPPRDAVLSHGAALAQSNRELAGFIGADEDKSDDEKDVERLEQMSSSVYQMLSGARGKNAASRTSAEQGNVERLERMLSDTLALLTAARAKVAGKRDRKKVKREESDVIDLT
ncbi:hypothetical protein C8J57DRAFT_1348177 [Mycena rebaudengoi]|nr:hypothetical protein C8J57DRAFT_1348177 [Mycena rebaudengoi]